MHSLHPPLRHLNSSKTLFSISLVNVGQMWRGYFTFHIFSLQILKYVLLKQQLFLIVQSVFFDLHMSLSSMSFSVFSKQSTSFEHGDTKVIRDSCFVRWRFSAPVIFWVEEATIFWTKWDIFLFIHIICIWQCLNNSNWKQVHFINMQVASDVNCIVMCVYGNWGLENFVIYFYTACWTVVVISILLMHSCLGSNGQPSQIWLTVNNYVWNQRRVSVWPPVMWWRPGWHTGQVMQTGTGLLLTFCVLSGGSSPSLYYLAGH